MKERFSKKLIAYKTLTGFFLGILFGTYFMLDVEVEAESNISPTQIMAIAALVCGVVFGLVMLIYSILYYKSAYFTLEENKIICHRGVIIKKRSNLDYKNINSVNKVENLFHKLFGVSQLHVDSGSANTSSESEIDIILDKGVIDEVMARIEAKKKGYTEVDAQTEVTNEEFKTINYSFGGKKKLLSSFVVSLNALFVIGVIALFSICAIAVFQQFGIIGYILLGVIGIWLVIFVIGLIAEVFAYYKFSITHSENTIKIVHGLIQTDTNTFSKDKVRSIKVTKGFFERIFKLPYVRCNVEVIGYVASKNNTQSGGVLFPLVKEDKLNDLLDEILPNFKVETRTSKAKDFVSFIAMKTLCTSIVFILTFLISIVSLLLLDVSEYILISLLLHVALFAILFVVYCIYGLLAKEVQSVEVGDGKVTIHSGGIYLISTVIPTSQITCVESITTHHRLKKNIKSYCIHYYSNAMTNRAFVNIMDSSVEEKLVNLMKF